MYCVVYCRHYLASIAWILYLVIGFTTQATVSTLCKWSRQFGAPVRHTEWTEIAQFLTLQCPLDTTLNCRRFWSCATYHEMRKGDLIAMIEISYQTRSAILELIHGSLLTFPLYFLAPPIKFLHLTRFSTEQLFSSTLKRILRHNSIASTSVINPIYNDARATNHQYSLQTISNSLLVFADRFQVSQLLVELHHLCSLSGMVTDLVYHFNYISFIFFSALTLRIYSLFRTDTAPSSCFVVMCYNRHWTVLCQSLSKRNHCL